MKKKITKSQVIDSLKPHREEVDAIDQKILNLLNQRAQVVLKIGDLKKQSSQEVFAPVREKSLIDNLTQKNPGPFPTHALRAVFGEILSASRVLQSPIKVAYLGPEATFTHLAALKSFGRSTELIPESSISKVFDAVEHKRAQLGVVPIENSTEGVVGATLDCFLDSPLKITSETTLPISHHLLSRAKNIKNIQRIYSHVQALSQCRSWLERNLPHIPLIEADSTARAAEKAAGDPHAAGIAGEHAAEIYGLNVLKKNIEDNSNNMTRFLIISQLKSGQGTRTGSDKTSILFSVKDQVGVLYKMLKPFYEKKINLTKIESRPLKKKAWEYIFFIDMDGHIEDKKIAEAIRELEKQCLFLKVLGSYPKATV
ncbi:MAG: prephenate dehydratase [Deltaproteobacteria bacterium]|nr:MAG: prephenate dehydratase [Deltaproteobacteria bacterium]